MLILRYPKELFFPPPPPDRILLFLLSLLLPSNARAGDVDLTFLLLKWLHSGRWTQKKTTIALFAKVGLRVSVRYFESSPIII